MTDIVKICNDDEMHKIESILFKMRDSKYLINQNLETQLNKYYSPVISKKIYQEYAKSYEYLSPTVNFEGSAIYIIQSSNPSVKIVYNSNIKDGYCSCLKLIHIGLPCAHIISVWRYLGNDLLNNILKYVSPHWKIFSMDLGISKMIFLY